MQHIIEKKKFNQESVSVENAPCHNLNKSFSINTGNFNPEENNVFVNIFDINTSNENLSESFNMSNDNLGDSSNSILNSLNSSNTDHDESIWFIKKKSVIILFYRCIYKIE